jgi:hypothetical protein
MLTDEMKEEEGAKLKEIIKPQIPVLVSKMIQAMHQILKYSLEQENKRGECYEDINLRHQQ